MHRSLSIIMACAILLAACAGTAPNVLDVQAGPGGLSSKKVEVNDKVLARQLAFGEVSVRPVGSSLQAQVMVQNLSSRDVNFEYRFIWYDSSGFEVSSLTAWIPATLAGKVSRGFKSTAPSDNAVSFKCMIRKPNPLNDM
ncbi:MAG: DUF1425 domain-containing protein [Deltaproteobacteria bacterium]|nr:DUF1425 domain-containing protein [Deltaproteobacteria bacterium]